MNNQSGPSFSADEAGDQGGLPILRARSAGLTASSKRARRKPIQPSLVLSRRTNNHESCVVNQFLTSNGVPSHGFVYAGGRHVVTYSAAVTSFMHADWLGTKRVMTTLTGIDAVNCTGLPFGDALNCVGYDRDFNEFTGDIHDSESNTEHTWFRQLSTTEGGWLSPDPASGSIDLGNPQSLNRYAYVGNSPLSGVDPLGLWCSAPYGRGDSPCNPANAPELFDGSSFSSPAFNWLGWLTGGGAGIETGLPGVFGSWDGPDGGLPIPGCILPGECPVQLPWPTLRDLLPHLPCNPVSPILDGCGVDNFADGKKLTADQKEECGRKAILSAAYAFLSDFVPTGIIDPRSGAVAAAVGVLSEWREIITNPAVAGKVARVLTPIAGEVAGEAAIPIAGEVILGAQVLHALYEAGVAANEADENCTAKYLAN